MSRCSQASIDRLVCLDVRSLLGVPLDHLALSEMVIKRTADYVSGEIPVFAMCADRFRFHILVLSSGHTSPAAGHARRWRSLSAFQVVGVGL